MRITTKAATAAGFTLTSMLFLNCALVGAQETSMAASTYKTPSATSASMTNTPEAPQLQGAGCGTIGPSDAVVTPIFEMANSQPVRSVDVVSGSFDGGQLLRGFSFNIDQFRGKLTEKAVTLLESLQNVGRKESTLAAPGGYSVIRQPATVSPAVF